jgi:hypothetical protein
LQSRNRPQYYETDVLTLVLLKNVAACRLLDLFLVDSSENMLEQKAEEAVTITGNPARKALINRFHSSATFLQHGNALVWCPHKKRTRTPLCLPWYQPVILFETSRRPCNLLTMFLVEVNERGGAVWRQSVGTDANASRIAKLYMKHSYYPAKFSVTTITQFANRFIRRRLVSNLDSGDHQAMVQ